MIAAAAAVGAGSIAIYGKNHHLGNLHMRRLVQRENDRPGDVRGLERQLELVKIVLLLRFVAAIARQDDIGSRQARLS